MPTTDVRLPELRFVPVEAVFPHEFHDHQRTLPLVERCARRACCATRRS